MSSPINKKRLNFFLLCRAIVDLCTEEYRVILLRRIKPSSLYGTLLKCADLSTFKRQDIDCIRKAARAGTYINFDITIIYKIFRTLFTQDLRDELTTIVKPCQIYTTVTKCPAFFSCPTTKLENSEIKALTYSATKNSYNHLNEKLLWKCCVHLCPHLITSLTLPTKPWGEDPDPWAKTVGDDIERIRILRNSVYGHVTTTKISHPEFKMLWKSLTEIAIRVDNDLGTRFKDSLDDIRNSSFDLRTEEKYIDQIKKLAEDLEQNKFMTDIIKTEMTAIKTELTEITKREDEINTGMTKLKSEIDYLKKEETTAQSIKNAKDPVPEHLRDRYNIQLKEWRSEDAVFVETRASNNVRNAIEKNTFVTVSGNAGSGKSAIIHHLALEFKSKGFDVLPVKDPDDIYKYLQIDQKQLFVYDDPVGVHCLYRDKLIKWLDFKLESSEITKDMKVLCSVRRQIVNESDFKSKLNILNKTIVDIQDDKNKLNLTEKIKMIKQHIKERQIELSVTEKAVKIIDKQDDLFPLACKFYVSSNDINKTNDWTFFQEPFQLILEDLEKMKSQDKVKYCILILCLFNENSLNPELYTSKSTVILRNEIELISACGLNDQSLLAGFKNGYKSLLNVYLKWENGILSFCHDLISDVISYHFGKKNPKKVLQYFPSKFISSRIIVDNCEVNDPYVIKLETKYIDNLVDRMLKDLRKKEKRDFKNIFMNKCWCNETFLDKFKKKFEIQFRGLTKRISVVGLNIFITPQTLNENTILDLKQMYYDNATDSSKCIAMAICSCIRGVTALHWIATFGHSKLFSYIWGNLSSSQIATICKRLPLLHFACLGGDIEIFNITLQTQTDKINTPLSPEIDLYPIHLACYENEDIIQRLLALGANVNVKCSLGRGKTVLFYAVEGNNFKACSLLIHHGYELGPCKYSECTYNIYEKSKHSNPNVSENTKLDLNETLEDGTSLLHITALNDSSDLAMLLLQHGANPNICNEKKCSPLFTAAEFNSNNVAKLLLKHGADPNFCDYNNSSPLYIAAECNNIDVAKILLQHGAKLNLCNTNHCSPLYAAAKCNSGDVAKLLLEHGAKLNLCNTNHCSPLYVAAKCNSGDVAKLLLEHGANLNLCNKNQCSPLYVAAEFNSSDVAKLLLECGADHNLCSNAKCTPLYVAAKCNSCDVAKLLLEHGAHPDLCNKEYRSPLYVAAKYNSYNVAEILLKHGADLNHCDINKSTPLFIAAAAKSVRVAKLLLKRGADPNVCSSNNYSPLYVAAECNSIDVAKLMLNNKADPNKCASEGCSPLFMAAYKNHTNFVKLLLDYKADTSLSYKGRKPLDVALYYKHKEVAYLLSNC